MREQFEFSCGAASDPSLAAPSADERFPAARFRIPCKFPVRAEQEIAFNRLIALGFSARNCGSEGLFRSFSLQIHVEQGIRPCGNFDDLVLGSRLSCCAPETSHALRAPA
jgi:hypothetical protein